MKLSAADPTVRREPVPRPRKVFSPNWLFKRFVPAAPFDDAYGAKGWWTRFATAQDLAWKTVSLSPPGWAERDQNLHIAILADLHLGSHTDDCERLIKIVSKINQRRPDLVLLLGDYVNMQPFGGGRIPPSVIAAILERLDAPLGIHAVLGNHDYSYGKGRISGALGQAGINVMENSASLIECSKGDFMLYGLADASQGRSALPGLLSAQMPGLPGVIMAHDPASFADVPEGPYLTVSGHTHGGQIRLPRFGALTNSSTAPMHWTSGHIVEGDRHLYVSNGIGTSIMPVRIGCPPEVNFVHLGAASGL